MAWYTSPGRVDSIARAQSLAVSALAARPAHPRSPRASPPTAAGRAGCPTWRRRCLRSARGRASPRSSRTRRRTSASTVARRPFASRARSPATWARAGRGRCARAGAGLGGRRAPHPNLEPPPLLTMAPQPAGTAGCPLTCPPRPALYRPLEKSTGHHRRANFTRGHFLHCGAHSTTLHHAHPTDDYGRIRR